MAFKGEDSKFSVATTVTLVLAVAAVVLVKAPLKSSRPSGNGIDLNGPTSVLKAHARLWEDPFAAVQKDLEARKHNGLLLMREGKVSLSVVGKGPTQSLTGDVKISSLLENIQSDGLTGLQNKIGEVTAREKQVTILLVMTRGGAYVDDSEWRIRDRYAVEAALEVGCFKSEQTQFLSYFTWNFKTDFGSRPFHTPYEWYRRSKIAVCQNLGEKIGERIVEGHDPQLLVLWLAAEESERSILQRIDALLTMVLKETHGAKISVQLVGPRSSSEFRALLKEIQGRGQTQRKDVSKKAAPFSWQKQSGRLTLYSPWATAMPGLLAYGLKPPIQEECNSYAACNKLFDEFLKDAGLDIRYSIGSDRVLFDSLFDELNRRRVIVGKDSIVLIGEWDSFYARALPLTFSAEACRHIGRCVSIEEAVDQFKRGAISPQDLSIKQYSYLSGLDGEVPENRASDFTSKGEKKAKEKEESGKTKIRDIASYEKPEGSSQLDYVRRLVARIKTEEQDNTDQKKKVKAIGILGTDAYDALLILQAVREEFRPSCSSRPIWTRGTSMRVNRNGLAICWSCPTSACSWCLNFNGAFHRFVVPIKRRPSWPCRNRSVRKKLINTAKIYYLACLRLVDMEPSISVWIISVRAFIHRDKMSKPRGK